MLWTDETVTIRLFHTNINSKRVNQKPVEVGNNKMGRTGTLKCAACRKRKRKVASSCSKAANE